MTTATGDVTLDLNGRSETLTFTLRAVKTVNALGGFQEALRRLSIFDVDAYVVVVAAGLGKRPSEVEEAVARNGFLSLTEPLSIYVGRLANGGKPLAGDAAEKDQSAGEQ